MEGLWTGWGEPVKFLPHRGRWREAPEGVSAAVSQLNLLSGNPLTAYGGAPPVGEQQGLSP